MRRYRPIAYVCCGGCTKSSMYTAWATFWEIYVERPNNCRFVVVENAPTNKHAPWWPQSPYLAWDLLSDKIDPTGLPTELVPPWPLWQADNPDALIVKAIALYDREHE